MGIFRNGGCLHMYLNVHKPQRERHLSYTDGSLVEGIQDVHACVTVYDKHKGHGYHRNNKA